MRLVIPFMAAVFSLSYAGALEGQNRGLDFGAGRWFADSGGVVYAATYYRHLFGPVDYGIGLTFLSSQGLGRTLRQTGAEFGVALMRDGNGPYLVAAGGVGMWHHNSDFDIQWSAGAGYAYRPWSFLSLGAEARYRVEDRDGRGFWRLNPDDRRGVLLSARVAFHLGSAPRVTVNGAHNGNDLPSTPSDTEIAREANTDAGSARTADLRTRVVRTALAAMGTPYKWGGTDSTGFDCSGLIQYSFGEHGIELPRTSRDQARSGEHIQRRVDLLRPGDILGFAASATRVTHVGLYVGDGKFIHSVSNGVKLSSLGANDSNSRWWTQRWVSARRVID